MSSIPTMYMDRQYRSQLEARWARLFDLVGWKYEYEPYPLKGWIPDFILIGKTGEILVEVKPFTTLDEFDTDKILGAMNGTGKAGREILLLGSTIFEHPDGADDPAVGWIGEQGESGPWFQWAMLDTQGGMGFLPDSGQFTNRMTGVYGGGHWNPPDFESVLRKWNQAGNAVKWRP